MALKVKEKRGMSDTPEVRFFFVSFCDWLVFTLNFFSWVKNLLRELK